MIRVRKATFPEFIACANKKTWTLWFNFDMINPQEEELVNSNLHFVFAEKLSENSNKINLGKNRPIFDKEKHKLINQSVHAFLIRTVIFHLNWFLTTLERSLLGFHWSHHLQWEELQLQNPRLARGRTERRQTMSSLLTHRPVTGVFCMDASAFIFHS